MNSPLIKQGHSNRRERGGGGINNKNMSPICGKKTGIRKGRMKENKKKEKGEI